LKPVLIKTIFIITVILSIYTNIFPEEIPACMINYKFGNEKIIIIVEKSTQQLFIYSNYSSKPLNKFRVTTGKKNGQKHFEGDLKTPEGIYYFRRTLSGNELPKTDDYGEKAFTLNYPNPIDRLEERGGSGIWLHGAFDSDKVKTPNSSRGCIVMNNDDLNKVSKYVFLNDTPVFVYETIPYNSVEEIKTKRSEFLNYLKNWKKAWENKNIDEYINSYSMHFTNNNMNINEFKRYKKRLNKLYKFIRVRLSNIAIYYYNNYYFASFNQLYISDKNHFYSKKIQYWDTSEGRPRIAFETSITKPPINKIEITKGNYISISKYRRNILNEKKSRYSFTSLNGIVLRGFKKSDKSINLTIKKFGKSEKQKIIPVLLIKTQESSMYKSINGVNLKNGIPQNRENAIILNNDTTEIKLEIEKNVFINSVNIFVFDKDNNYKQILTYFIRK